MMMAILHAPKKKKKKKPCTGEFSSRSMSFTFSHSESFPVPRPRLPFALTLFCAHLLRSINENVHINISYFFWWLCHFGMCHAHAKQFPPIKLTYAFVFISFPCHAMLSPRHFFTFYCCFACVCVCVCTSFVIFSVYVYSWQTH